MATAIDALTFLPPEASLDVQGEGSRTYAAELEELARRHGVADRVRFGRSSHAAVPEVYAEADVLVFPVTWHEPWGLVPREAMSIGRPVVASRSGGGPAEYLAEGGNCLQFEPGDARQLAGAVRRLSEDAGLRDRLVATGRQTASGYTEASFHDGILQAIADVRGAGS